MSEKIEEKNNENKINERINWEKHEEILDIYKKFYSFSMIKSINLKDVKCTKPQ